MADQDQAQPGMVDPASAHPSAGPLDRLRACNEQLTIAALHAREQADDAEVRYRDLVEGLDAIVWEAIADPWRFTFVSERAVALVGRPVQQWTSAANILAEVIHPEDRDEALAALHRHAADLKDFRLQFRVVGHGGQCQWMAMIGRHSRETKYRGYYRGLLVNIEDSIRAETFEKMVAEQTRELTNQQADLRALGTELNLAEHRMRTKIAGELHDHLAQMLALARMKLGQARQVTTAPAADVEYIAQAETVLNDCLTYTRTLVAELCPPVLHEFGLPAALAWLARYMRQYDLAVTCELPLSAPWRISADEAVLLFQSVRELLVNVAKHADTGKATVQLHVKGQMLEVVVHDEGRGFDPLAFTQTEASQSSRFGLFSIRERMRALGGRFETVSILGKGTRSVLALPLPADASLGPPSAAENSFEAGDPLLKRETSQESSRGTASKTFIRVLLVDDHFMLRESLRTVVNSYTNLQVIAEAGDGVEAVEAVRKFRPDVVVMDINMPRMNGIEAARLIKREFPQIGIVGLSMHDASDMVERTSAAGISAYVSKGAAVSTLCRAIEGAVSQR